MEHGTSKFVKYTKKVCYELQFGATSGGLFNENANVKPVIKHDLPHLQIQILLIFFITHVSHSVLWRFKIPKFASQMLAGVILGPFLFGKTRIIKDVMFPPTEPRIIDILSRVGFTFFLFIIGVKTDASMVFRTGKKAWTLGLLSYLIPSFISLGLVRNIRTYFLPPGKQWEWALFVGTIQSITPFPVVSTLLQELEIVNSELGRLGLSAALISDLLNTSIFIFWKLLGSLVTQHIDKVLEGSVMLVLFILIIAFVLRPAMLWVVRQTPEGKPVKDRYMYAVYIAIFLCAWVSDRYNRSLILGVYILGLAVPPGPPLGSALVNRIESFSADVLMPLMTTTTVMRADLQSIVFGNKKIAIFTIILVMVVFLIKFAACLMIPLHCKIPFKDAVTIALILSCKGIIEIACYGIPNVYKIIPSEAYAIVILHILISAAVIPILIKALYDPSRKYAGYQKRSVMDLKPNAELKVVIGIHNPENIEPIIKLLDAFNPTKESPITAYAIHLIELLGRASPIFISHQIQKRDSRKSYSRDIIQALSEYENSNDQGAVSLNYFTAVSLPQFMQEDVCNIALDNLASLIILPFHQQWSREGVLKSESKVIRNLNCSVLERAPCSVGVLVDHGHLEFLTSETSLESMYHVGMIYIGGKDDREALSVATRMVRDSRDKLTVMHLVSTQDECVTDWESVLDMEALKNVKLAAMTNQNLVYKKELVDDGSQTSSAVRTMANKCDIVLAGRRYGTSSPQTSGLHEWCEFPELGVIGDLLASPEFNKASVLIVQQQLTYE